MAEYELRGAPKPGRQQLLIDGVASGYWVTINTSKQHGQHYGHTVVWEGHKGLLSHSGGWTSALFLFARRVLGDTKPSVVVFRGKR